MSWVLFFQIIGLMAWAYILVIAIISFARGKK